jgi:hypothetical protein
MQWCARAGPKACARAAADSHNIISGRPPCLRSVAAKMVTA